MAALSSSTQQDGAIAAKRRVVVTSGSGSNVNKASTGGPNTPSSSNGSNNGRGNPSIFNSNSSNSRASPGVTTPGGAAGGGPSGVSSSVRARVLGYSSTTTVNTPGRSPSPSPSSQLIRGAAAGAAAASPVQTPPNGHLPASTSTQTQRRVRAASTEPPTSSSQSYESPTVGTGSSAGRAIRILANNNNAASTPPMSPSSKRAKTVFPSTSTGTTSSSSATAVHRKLGPPSSNGSGGSTAHVRVRAQSQAPPAAAARATNGSPSSTNVASLPSQRTVKATVSDLNLAAPYGGLLPSPTLSGSTSTSTSSSRSSSTSTPASSSAATTTTARTRLKSSVSTSAGDNQLFARSTTASTTAPRNANVRQGAASPTTPAAGLRASSRPASPVRGGTSGGTPPIPTGIRRPASPVRANTLASNSSPLSTTRRPASPVRPGLAIHSHSSSSSRFPVTEEKGKGIVREDRPRPKSPFKPSSHTPASPIRAADVFPRSPGRIGLVDPPESAIAAGKGREVHAQTISSISSSSGSTLPACEAPRQSANHIELLVAAPTEPDISISSFSSCTDDEEHEEEEAHSYTFSSGGISGASTTSSSSVSGLSSVSTAATSALGVSACNSPLVPPVGATRDILLQDRQGVIESADTPIASRYYHRSYPAGARNEKEEEEERQSSPIATVASRITVSSPSPFQEALHKEGSSLPLAVQSGSTNNSASTESPAEREAREEKEHRDAKVRRKILDLEITNKSLLAINSTLERTKLSQATELRDLRRAVREGHFSGSSRLPLHTAPIGSFLPLQSPDLDYFPKGALDSNDNDEDQQQLPWEEVLALDPGFGDVVRALETLHVRALQALQRTRDTSSDVVGGKVLSQFALEKRPPPLSSSSILGRPPLSPGKSTQAGRRQADPADTAWRRGRTLSSSGSGQDATTRIKQGLTITLPLSPEPSGGINPEEQEDGTTPDISISTSAATEEEEETSAMAGTTDVSGTTEEGESMTTSSSSSYLYDNEDSIRSDDRSRTSSAHTAEMSLGVD